MSSLEALLENGQIHRLLHPNCRWTTLLHLNPPVPFESTLHALGLIYSFYQGLIEQNPRMLRSFLFPLNRPHYALHLLLSLKHRRTNLIFGEILLYMYSDSCHIHNSLTEIDYPNDP